MLLEPRRDVDGVACHEKVAGVTLACCDDLAGVHTDPQGERGRLWVGSGRVTKRQRGEQCAVGVIAVGLGDAEYRHDGVADEFLDRPAMLADDLARDRVVAAEHGARVLGVVGLTERRRSGDVGEQHGDDAAFFGHDAILAVLAPARQP